MWRGILVCLAIASLLSCAGGGPKATAKLEDVMAQEASTQQQAQALNTKLFAAVKKVPQAQDYIVGEGDLLQVTVFESPDLSREVRVSSRGCVTLALLGTLEVKGLTVREAEQKIEDAYRQKYIEEPHVNVFVKERQGGKITLLGALQKPGTYNYYARQGLLSVLALGGGLSDKAGAVVQITRAGKDPDHPTTFMIDMDELVKKGRADLNIDIHRGDVIFVPEGGVVFVDGAVRRPGSYPIKNDMTIAQSIANAGGFRSTADQGDIKLVRYLGSGKREVVKLGIDEIRDGAATNLIVKDRDIVFVETNKLVALVYGLRLNMWSGLVGFGYTPPRE